MMELEMGNKLVVTCTCHGKNLRVVVDNNEERLMLYIENENKPPAVMYWAAVGEEDGVKPLTEDQWAAKYCPKDGTADTYMNYERVSDTYLNTDQALVWSVLAGGPDGEAYIIPGFRLDVLGYLVSEKPYEEAHGHVMGRWKMEAQAQSYKDYVASGDSREEAALKVAADTDLHATEVKRYMRDVLSRYKADTVIHDISATTSPGYLQVMVTRTHKKRCEVDVYRYGEKHDSLMKGLGHGGKSGDPSKTIVLFPSKKENKDGEA